MIDPTWKEAGLSNMPKAKKFLSEYSFSSYLDYVEGGERDESILLKKELFPDYFSQHQEFESFIEEWLNFTKDSPWQL